MFETLSKEPNLENGFDASDTEEGLAAAEVVVALKGHPAPDLPEEVTEWIEKNKETKTNKLIPLALKMIDSILQKSEVLDLWIESDNLVDWKEQVGDLRTRLLK